jgi:hypothetical protein
MKIVLQETMKMEDEPRFRSTNESRLWPGPTALLKGSGIDVGFYGFGQESTVQPIPLTVREDHLLNSTTRKLSQDALHDILLPFRSPTYTILSRGEFTARNKYTMLAIMFWERHWTWMLILG